MKQIHLDIEPQAIVTETPYWKEKEWVNSVLDCVTVLLSSDLSKSLGINTPDLYETYHGLINRDWNPQSIKLYSRTSLQVLHIMTTPNKEITAWTIYDILREHRGILIHQSQIPKQLQDTLNTMVGSIRIQELKESWRSSPYYLIHE